MGSSLPGSLRRAASIALIAAFPLLPLPGCVVYEPVPAYQPPSTYERSWAAALGAFQDQGVAVQSEDRATGVIRGTRGGTTVTAAIRTQADGRVRVEFNTSGGGSEPDLVDRISASYGRRMGR